MKKILVNYIGNQNNAVIELPPSKSESNRVLIIKALSNCTFKINNLSNAQDTVILKKALTKISLIEDFKETITIDIRGTGTAMRFLTAFLSIRKGKWMLKGNKRMEQRTIEPLVDALIQIGASISYLNNDGFPPLLIEGKTLTGGIIEIDSSLSSQYISALLMIAPLLKEGLIINLKGNIASEPYILLTLKIMEYFGIKHKKDNTCIEIINQNYQPAEININYDWSAASYFYEIIALSEPGTTILLHNLRKENLQGDEIVIELYKKLGVSTIIENNGIRIVKIRHFINEFSYDFSNCPDLAPTLIVSCAALGIKGCFSGLKSLKIKETNRILALKNELCKLGCDIEVIKDDCILIKSKIRTCKNKFIIKTYNDHRMAMSFAPIAMLFNQIIIENPNVVNKSFVEYWDNINKIGFKTMLINRN